VTAEVGEDLILSRRRNGPFMRNQERAVFRSRARRSPPGSLPDPWARFPTPGAKGIDRGPLSGPWPRAQARSSKVAACCLAPFSRPPPQPVLVLPSR